jgi:hypothetical protein
VANHDRTVHPDLERFSAKRMGATTYAVGSSHVPMLAHPSLVVDVICAAAKRRSSIIRYSVRRLGDFRRELNRTRSAYEFTLTVCRRFVDMAPVAVIANHGRVAAKPGVGCLLWSTAV